MAARLAPSLSPGSVVALHGDLGSGKTTFVRGLARGLGVEEMITSPSFALIHEYDGRVPLYHVDLYRIERSEEAELLDLDAYLYSEGITVIEWAERAPDLLPAGTVRVEITLDFRGSRERPPWRRIDIAGPSSRTAFRDRPDSAEPAPAHETPVSGRDNDTVSDTEDREDGGGS